MMIVGEYCWWYVDVCVDVCVGVVVDVVVDAVVVVVVVVVLLCMCWWFTFLLDSQIFISHAPSPKCRKKKWIPFFFPPSFQPSHFFFSASFLWLTGMKSQG